MAHYHILIHHIPVTCIPSQMIENNGGIDSLQKLWVKAKNQHFQKNFRNTFEWLTENVDIRYLRGILTCMLYLYDIPE